MIRTMICACVVLAAACSESGETPEVASDTVGAFAARYPRCDSIAAQVPADLAAFVTGEERVVMETHDCQQLIVGEAFGPLAAVYPLVDSLHGDAAAFQNWRTVASIVTWDGAYEPLSIEAGANCLRMRQRNGEWEARIDGGDACPQHQLVNIDADRNLDVHPQTYVGSDTAHPDRPIYPATARFRWNGDAREYYIGIKCGEAWCSVGRAAALPTSATITGPLYFNMPGYFDEQPIALIGGGVVRIGPVVSIHPDDAILDVGKPGQEESEDSYATVRMVNGADVGDNNIVSRNLGLKSEGNGSRGTMRMNVAQGVAHVRQWQGLGKRDITVAINSGQHSGAPSSVRWRWVPLTTRIEPFVLTDSATLADAPADSAFLALLAATTVPAAAWIPCQADNCCTATW